MQFQFQFIGGVAKNKTAKLKYLILLSRVTYWAPVEMLLDKGIIIIRQTLDYGLAKALISIMPWSSSIILHITGYIVVLKHSLVI
jgi:hypothetical protein